MSDFEEFAVALLATARFELRDGRSFVMSIDEQDRNGNLQLGIVGDQPQIRAEDFEQLAAITYYDGCGRIAQVLTRTAPTPVLQS